jgi:hypothetical protein
VARLSANSMSMNLRHAAALALVGWYLIGPPVNAGKPVVADWDAPVSKWLPVAFFDTAADCQKEIEAVKPRAEERARQAHTKLPRDPFLCVNDDDPRMMGNPNLRFFKMTHSTPAAN